MVSRQLLPGHIYTVLGPNLGPVFTESGGKAGVVVDANSLYVAEPIYGQVCKVTVDGRVTLVAGRGSTDYAGGFSGDGGLATLAQLSVPLGLAIDGMGNLYIADSGNNRIRKVDRNGIITTAAGSGAGGPFDTGFSGDGQAAVSARLSLPEGLAADVSGTLYIADTLNNRIRKVDTTGIISTVAGNGSAGFSGDGQSAISASLQRPKDVAVDTAGNLYIADAANSRIRKVDVTGIITTVAGMGVYGYSGDDGPAIGAEIRWPESITVDPVGNLYFDDVTGTVRRVSPSGIISRVAGGYNQGYNGDGDLATLTELELPGRVAADKSGNLYVAELSGRRVRKLVAPLP